MLKRILNLIKLSKYKVIDNDEITENGIKERPATLIKDKKMASIVDLNKYDALKEFPDYVETNK